VQGDQRDVSVDKVRGDDRGQLLYAAGVQAAAVRCDGAAEPVREYCGQSECGPGGRRGYCARRVVQH